ncbi:MAG: hypothetical protein ACK4UY_03875 [Dietzia sp.]
MSEFPLPFPILRITLVEGAEDALGNPVTTTTAEELACAWWVPTSEEKVVGGHQITETVVFAMVDAADGWGAGHQATVPGFDPDAVLEVDGRPVDHTHGPWASEWPLDRVQITLKEARG